jgi:hypothetical protein
MLSFTTCFIRNHSVTKTVMSSSGSSSAAPAKKASSLDSVLDVHQNNFYSLSIISFDLHLFRSS